MAEKSKQVLKKGIKLVSITEFRTKYAGGVTSQAIDYAIKNDLVDFVQVTPKIRVIVLNAHSLSYDPNKSPKRGKSILSM